MCYIPLMARVTASYVVPGWATGVNYPAGSDPWSGTPTKVAPPSVLNGFTPNTAAAAEYVNYELNAAFTTDAAAKTAINALADAVGQGEVLRFDAAGFTSCFKSAYDVVDNRWLISANIGTNLPYISWNGGQSWTAMAAWPVAVVSKPILGSNPAGMVVGVDGAGGLAFSLPSGSNTWTNWTLPGVLNTFREVTWLASGSTFIALGTSGTVPIMYKSTGAANWTNATSAIPAAFAAVATHWSCASSPTLFVAVPRNVTTGGNYMTSSDGVTFTLRTTLPNVANFAGRAVHYNAVEGLWMYVSLFTNFSANQITVYTSPDGFNWTQKVALGSLNWEVWDLTSAGGVWAMLVQRDVGTAIERTTVIYSVDNGASWRVTDAAALGTGGADTPRNQIMSDGNRLMWNIEDELYVGSHTAGLKALVT